MTTIKIKSTDVATQGDFVIISLADFDSAQHEPFDDESRAALAGAVTSGEIVPSMAELLAARDSLVRREAELDAERDRLALQAAANEAEAQRLRDEAAALAASQAAALDPAGMTKEQLQAALTAKAISYPAAANKADLLALLTAA